MVQQSEVSFHSIHFASKNSHAFSLLFTALVAISAGCGGGGSTIPTIASVAVSCSPPSIITTQSSTCAASVSGTGSYSSAVTWTAKGGTITNIGVFTPSGAGMATVTATSTPDNSKSGSANITISEASTAAGIYTVGRSYTGSSGQVGPPFGIYRFSKSSPSTPNQVLSGPATMVATAIALDQSGRFYVGAQQFDGTQQTGLMVLVYDAGASGAAAPIETINLSLTGDTSSVVSIALDNAQNLYMYIVSDSGSGSSLQIVFQGIEVMTRSAAGVYSQSRMISGNATTISDIRQISVDPQGDIYAASYSSSSILIFDPNATGDTSPTATLVPYPVSNPTGVFVDSAGNIYVAGLTNYVAPASARPQTIDTSQHVTVSEFPPGSTGNAVPSLIMSPGNNLEYETDNLTVDGAGNIYVVTSLYEGNYQPGNGIWIGAPGSTGTMWLLSDSIGPSIVVY